MLIQPTIRALLIPANFLPQRTRHKACLVNARHSLGAVRRIEIPLEFLFDV